jgi:D-ornithine 4,5-aminomutase subunit beta
VGLREIIDIKHGGIERFGMEIHYLGTSVPVEKLVDAAVELKAEAILASTIISHDNIHYKNMKRLHELAVEKGIRDDIIILAGGTQVVPEEALKTGIDHGFGRNTKGIDVATVLIEKRREKRNQ